MALDIGLGQKLKAKQGAGGVRDRNVLDSESMDSRRTLLACYLCCARLVSLFILHSLLISSKYLDGLPPP